MAEYVPNRRDLVWIDFNPQAGHKQSGLRPAVILSPNAYNKKVGLALICLITTQVKGFPFEVILPKGLKISGAILSDQVKSLDWRKRRIKYKGELPEKAFKEVIEKLRTILN